MWSQASTLYTFVCLIIHPPHNLEIEVWKKDRKLSQKRVQKRSTFGSKKVFKNGSLFGQKSVQKWSTFWSFFGPVFGQKKFKKPKFSYHNSNPLLNFIITEKSQISIGRLFYVFLIVRSFQLFPWLMFWSYLDHFGNRFLLQRFIQNRGKSWKYEKLKIADTTPKLKKTGPKTVQNCPKPWKMDDFRQKW